MISIIITAYKEEKTIEKTINSIENQKFEKHETIVIAPDNGTLKVARKLKKTYLNLRVIKDLGEGKPSALNLAVSKSKGNILILTDGDVYLGKNSISQLIKPFKDPKIGAVTGRPISEDSKNNLFGFWGHILSDTAHERRTKAKKNQKRFFCSGYLFAIRKKLFPNLKEGLLSEDGYISHKVYAQGYKIGYSPESRVYIKYPTHFKDWINQKKRSAGGYNQIKKMEGIEIRSFKKESLGGFKLLKYPRNLREFVYLFKLFIARTYLWYVIYRDINIKKKTHKELWVRVESTK